MKTWLVTLALVLLAASPVAAFTTSPTGVTPTTTYTEPTTVVGGAPITDLISTRIYWKLSNGAETMITIPATKPTGGGAITYSGTSMPVLPCQKDVITENITAVNPGGESVRVAVSLAVDRTKEPGCVPTGVTGATIQ